MTDKEKAQEAWKKHFEANLLGYHRDLKPTKSGIIQFADTAISDYREALKKEIKEIKEFRGVNCYYADGRTWAFEKVLELLDTIKPIL